MESSGLPKPSPTKWQELRSILLLGFSVVVLLALVLFLGNPARSGANQPLHAKLPHSQNAPPDSYAGHPEPAAGKMPEPVLDAPSAG